MNTVADIIQSIITPGKGIFANDASEATLTKRFEKVGLSCTIETRNEFRKMLYSTPGLSSKVSGVILNEEAVSFATLLSSKGIIPGVKIYDMKIPNQVRDDKDIKFLKYRETFEIGLTSPTQEVIEENVNRLVNFAKISLSHELAPIVEPEVLMDGEHSLQDCSRVTTQVLTSLFSALEKEGIGVENIILKMNMILPGKLHSPSSPIEVGKNTVEVIRAVVPKNIGGIVFLSGGQSPKEAIDNLHEIQKQGPELHTTFSFERVFEEPVLEVWGKNMDDIDGAQAKLLEVLGTI